MLLAVAGCTSARPEASGGTETRTEARTEGALYERSFDFQMGSELVVDLGDEAVRVLPARGDRATVIVVGEGRDAAREFERRRFRAESTGAGVTVRTNPPRSSQTRSSDARFIVAIRVPVGSNARIDVGSGSVRVADLIGNLNVNTGSGEISVGVARGGRMVLRTGSGDIRAQTLGGEIRATTGSGAIYVGRARGSFLGDSGSGDITVVRGDVSRFVANTGSGSITAGFWRDAEIEIDAGSGNVELTLAKDARADANLSGSSVRIADVLRFRGENRRGDARGTLGGGGPQMEIDTGSGSITLKTR